MDYYLRLTYIGGVVDLGRIVRTEDEFQEQSKKLDFYVSDPKNPFNNQLLLLYGETEDLRKIDYQPGREMVKYRDAYKQYFAMYPRRSNVPMEIINLNYVTLPSGERVNNVWSTSGRNSRTFFTTYLFNLEL